MNKRISILPGVEYKFRLPAGRSSQEPYLDFLDESLQTIIFHVKYKSNFGMVVLNAFSEGVWVHEEEISLVDYRPDMIFSIIFATGAAVFRVGDLSKRYLFQDKVATDIRYVRAFDFEEIDSLLEMRGVGGASSIEMSSLEYTILEARLSKLELLAQSSKCGV